MNEIRYHDWRRNGSTWGQRSNRWRMWWTRKSAPGTRRKWLTGGHSDSWSESGTSRGWKWSGSFLCLIYCLGCSCAWFIVLVVPVFDLFSGLFLIWNTSMSHEIDIDLVCNKEAIMSKFDTFLTEMHYELWRHSNYCINPVMAAALLHLRSLSSVWDILDVPIVSFLCLIYCLGHSCVWFTVWVIPVFDLLSWLFLCLIYNWGHLFVWFIIFKYVTMVLLSWSNYNWMMRHFLGVLIFSYL
jgi:hypothetical protein